MILSLSKNFHSTTAKILLYRFWQLLAGFGTTLLIGRTLTPKEQGFFYTFNSILATQIFFELGLTVAIVQFVSHEKAFLSWDGGNRLTGSKKNQSRMASILSLSLKWYFIVSLILVIVLIPFGLIFFNNMNTQIIWEGSWAWIVCSTSLNLLLIPFIAFLEGCGLIKEVAKRRLNIELISYPCYWLALSLGLGLNAPPLFQTIKFVLMLAFIFSRRKLFTNVLKEEDEEKVRWKEEIWPLQWKLGLSWISGFFVYHLFNPILFKFYGPIEAGKMGMTIALTTAITTLSISWISSKVPMFGKLVAQNRTIELDYIFKKSLLKSFIASLFFSICLLLFVVSIKFMNFDLARRVLDIRSVIFLTLTAVINVLIFGLASYLRSYKKEPLLPISVIMAIMSCFFAYYIGKKYSSFGLAQASFYISCFGLSSSFYIFINKKKEWTNNE